MNLWTIVHFGCFAAYVIAIFYIILKNPFAVVNWVLAMLFFYFALWSAGNGIMYNTTTTIETANIVYKVQSFAWASFITYYFLFIVYLTGNRRLLSSHFLMLSIVTIPFVFVFQTFNGKMLYCCEKVHYGLTASWENTPWVAAFFVYYAVMFLAGTYLLFRYRNSTGIKSERRIADILLASAVTVFVAGTLVNVFLKTIGKFYPLDSNVVFMVFAAGFIFCAERYEAFSLTSARNADMVMDIMSDGVIMMSSEGELTSANRAAMDIFGFHPRKGSLEGTAFIEEKLKEAGITPAEPVVTNHEFAFQDAEGKTKTVLISSRPVSTGRDNPGCVCTVRDISEKKRAEVDLVATVKELKRSNEELESFAYLASHDLKEPLRMVSSFVQLLRKKFSDKMGPDANDYINYATEGAARMSELIEDLLEYSRVKSRQKEFTAVDTAQVVGRVLDTMKYRIEDKKAAVSVETPLPVVKADGIQMEQLFQNLIGNALKFSGKEAPAIRISSTRKDGFHEFIVRDNGIGIDMQYKERIFQIFQRLHGREQYDGTGMGLAICRKIAETHGGRIWMESEGEGRGSAFHFTLPG